MKRDVPEPWASAMVKAGMVDPRYGNPSYSALAREVLVHTSTITAMVHGSRDTDVETISAVANALGVSPQMVGEWIGETRTIGELYEPPAESRFLSQGERSALTALIKQIADGKSESGSQGNVVPLRPNDDGTPSRSAALESSEADERVSKAALETTEGLDESPGGSDPDVE